MKQNKGFDIRKKASPRDADMGRCLEYMHLDKEMMELVDTLKRRVRLER